MKSMDNFMLHPILLKDHGIRGRLSPLQLTCFFPAVPFSTHFSWIITHTIDETNPAITTWDENNPVNSRINYQPQLVNRFFSINSIIEYLKFKSNMAMENGRFEDVFLVEHLVFFISPCVNQLYSGQISIIPKPELRGFGGDSLF